MLFFSSLLIPAVCLVSRRERLERIKSTSLQTWHIHGRPQDACAAPAAVPHLPYAPATHLCGFCALRLCLFCLPHSSTCLNILPWVVGRLTGTNTLPLTSPKSLIWHTPPLYMPVVSLTTLNYSYIYGVCPERISLRAKTIDFYINAEHCLTHKLQLIHTWYISELMTGNKWRSPKWEPKENVYPTPAIAKQPPSLPSGEWESLKWKKKKVGRGFHVCSYWRVLACRSWRPAN